MNESDKEALANRLGTEAQQATTIDGLPKVINTISRDVNMMRMDLNDFKESQAVEIKLLRSEVQAVAPLGALYLQILILLLGIGIGLLIDMLLKKQKPRQPRR